jgi:hypothetical protein
MSDYTRHVCDACNVVEAEVWVDDKGAVCYDCARPVVSDKQNPSSDVTAPLDFDWVYG